MNEISPYRSPLWNRVRLATLERDHYRCQVRLKGCRGVANEADHIIPWRDGGAWFELTNLRAACGYCNTLRAQQQKARDGWKRAHTRIVLVIGPPGNCVDLSEYVQAHAAPGDLVIDYRAIAAAIGNRPEAIKKVRGSLLTNLRRGEETAARAWITSTNPKAEAMFPHHEVITVEYGADYARDHGGAPELVEAWYSIRCPALAREW